MADHLERLAFIEETSVKINMARTTGWAPRGQRLVDHTPFGQKPKRLRRGPTISYGKPLDMSATSSQKRNATTSS